MTQYEKDIKAGRIDPSIEATADPRSAAEILADFTKNAAWMKHSFAIGLRVLLELEQKGWSKTKLAQELNISPQAVQKYFSGECNFTLETIAKLEEALGIELMQVMPPMASSELSEVDDENASQAAEPKETYGK